MIASAQVSVYALRQPSLGSAIDAIRHALEDEGIEARTGPMSTVATGEIGQLFAALQKGYTLAAAEGQVVLVVTMSNACPLEDTPADGMGDL